MIEYTKLSDALGELERRRYLRPEVEKYLAQKGLEIPWKREVATSAPLAVIFRQVATPNYEIMRFLSIAAGFDLHPLILEYPEDKLSMENSYKKSLLQAPILKRVSAKGHISFEKKWLCAPEDAVPQRKISTIQSANRGASLVDLHHQALRKIGGNYEYSVVDGSSWFFQNGGSSKSYYQTFFSLFISHAILFENFPLSGPEESFTGSVATPSFDETARKFGVNPLVVPINPTQTEESSFWFCYPEGVFN